MKRLEDYPRVVVIQSLNHDDKVAWVKPFALIEDKYTQPLPSEMISDFGVEFAFLVAKKGLESQLSTGDAFKYLTANDDGKIDIIGGYLPGLDTL